MSTALDFSLLRQRVPPIAGPGSEVSSWSGPSWCGYCGYTGRVLGPVQASCPERRGWHRWLASCADNEIWLGAPVVTPLPTKRRDES